MCDLLHRGGKELGEPEGVRRRTVLLVALQTLAALRDARDVAGGNPPETVVRLVHFFKPLGAIAKSLDVSGRVDVVAQRFDGGPDRHVDDDEGIVVVGELGGVSRSRLQAPDKTGSRIRESVDGIELGDKAGDLGIVQRCDETADVDLSEMEIHGGILPYGANSDDGHQAAGEWAFAAVAEEEIGAAGGTQVSGINVVGAQA